MDLKKPVCDVKTRWNSTMEMLNWAIDYKKPISLTCSIENSLKEFNISDNEWSNLEKLLKYLKPFKTLTDLFSGEKYPTISTVVIGINLLLDKIDCWITTLNENVIFDNKIKDCLIAARNKILKHYNRTNWMYCVSLISDPRHKLETFDRTSWGKELKNRSLQTFHQVFKNYENGSLVVVSEEASSNDEFDLNMSSLFKKRDLSNEFESYLLESRADEHQDILMWWKERERVFPRMSTMARDFFCIQASSVSIERQFSKAGLVLTKNRNRINTKPLKSLLCLNSFYNV